MTHLLRLVSDNDGDGEEMFVDSFSSVSGDDRDSATLEETATAGTVDTDRNKLSENTARERVADDIEQPIFSEGRPGGECQKLPLKSQMVNLFLIWHVLTLFRV